jgi:carbamoyltransferase
LLGFQALADEGKVEALAAYGNHNNEIYDKLMTLVTLDKAQNCLVLDAQKSMDFLSVKNLKPLIEKYSKEDAAAAVQKFLEDVTIPYFKHIIDVTGIDNLCLSGGVAANVIMNLKIFEEVTQNIHIIPAMGDEGTAEGVAIALMLSNGYNHQDIEWIKHINMPYFGSEYSNDEVAQCIKNSPVILHKNLGPEWHSEVAELLNKGKIGALFQGKMEWGPRALGNRSIVALANDSDTRVKMNKEIKKRPEFQPFCPSILLDERDRLFESSYANSHMTCAFRMKAEFIHSLPSAVHIDGTARVQFVSKEDNKNYYSLLQEVKKLTGFGVLINTSFNKHGRTIVETPQDAIDDFIDTDLDFMMIGHYLVTRK